MQSPEATWCNLHAKVPKQYVGVWALPAGLRAWLGGSWEGGTSAVGPVEVLVDAMGSA